MQVHIYFDGFSVDSILEAEQIFYKKVEIGLSNDIQVSITPALWSGKLTLFAGSPTLDILYAMLAYEQLTKLAISGVLVASLPAIAKTITVNNCTIVNVPVISAKDTLQPVEINIKGSIPIVVPLAVTN